MYGPKNIGFLFVAVEDCQKGEASLTVLVLDVSGVGCCTAAD